MYRNLMVVMGGCVLLLLVFFINFGVASRGRADFIWNNGTEPQTLDPGRMSGQPEHRLALGLFEGLTNFHPKTLEPLPGVAHAWEQEGLTYIFHLRDDAWWVHRDAIFESDGKKRNVTAQDFVYAWRRHLHPETGSEYSYVFHIIVGAEEYEKVVAENWNQIVERYQKDPKLSSRILTGPGSLTPEDRDAVVQFRDTKWRELVAIKDPSPTEIRVTLKSPAPYFLTNTSFYVFAPVCPEVLEAHHDFWILPENIVTNGAYFLDEWKFNSLIRLRKNRHYWENAEQVAAIKKDVANQPADQPLPTYRTSQMQLLQQLGPFVENGLETLEAWAVEDVNTSLNLYLNGDVDMDPALPTEVIGELIAASGKPLPQNPEQTFDQLHHGLLGSIYYYCFNMQLPIFGSTENGRKLRRAMSLAADRQGMIDVVTRSHQQPAYAMVPGPIEGYDQSPLFGSGDYQKDLEEAKRLVAEVRQSGVTIPTIRVLYNTSQGHQNIAAFLQNIWQQQLGISVQLVNQEWGVYLDAKRNGGFDVCRAGWIGDYPDPSSYLDLFVSSNQNNDPRFSNPIYDHLVQRYAMETLDYLSDPKRREAMLADIKSWDRYQLVKDRKRADGRTLDATLTEAIDRFSKMKEDDPGRLKLVAEIRLYLYEVAELILMDAMPIMPLYFYTTTQLWPPELEGIDLNMQDTHPPKFFRWKDGKRPSGPRYDLFPSFSPRSRPEANPPAAVQKTEPTAVQKTEPTAVQKTEPTAVQKTEPTAGKETVPTADKQAAPQAAAKEAASPSRS